MGSTIAILSDWHLEEAWGVLQSRETGNGCWFLFDSLENIGVDDLELGGSYLLEYEAVEQDGYQYRATRVSPMPGQENVDSGWRPSTGGTAYDSTLKLSFERD